MTLATHAMREMETKSFSTSYGSDFLSAGSDAKPVAVASNNVYPSGAAFFAISIPMIPLAPERLSTTTCCFICSASLPATIRARISGEPPGGEGTRKRIGLVG